LIVRTLQVVSLKPNPIGKDRNRSGATAAQLGGEWVDVKNTGYAALELAGVDIYHLAFGPGSPQGRWEKIMSLVGRLESGRVLRVHAGQFRDLSVLRAEDRAGADLHTFTGDDAYVWNNREGDTALLWLPDSKSEIDKASYDPNPPEGVALIRVGNKLVPASARIGVRL
jgi:hypothetical protein